MLNPAVDAFGSGVGDPVFDVSEDTFQMTLEHSGDVRYGLEARMGRPKEPSLEEFESGSLVDIAPELSESLLQSPGPADFEAFGLKSPESRLLLIRPPGGFFKPEVLGFGEQEGALFDEVPILAAPHFVDSLVQVFGDVELVVDDFGGGQILSRGFHVGVPHVHGDGFNGRLLGVGQGLDETPQRLVLPVLGDVENPGVLDIRQDGGVLVPPKEAFLVDSEIGHLFGLAALKAAPDRLVLDVMDFVPAHSQEVFGARLVRAGQEHINRQPLEERREAGMFLSPRDLDAQDSMLGALDSWNLGSDEGFELHGVQVSPDSFLSLVVDRTRLTALGAQSLRDGVSDHDVYAQSYEIHLGSRYLPGFFDSHEFFVKLPVLHDDSSVLEDFPPYRPTGQGLNHTNPGRVISFNER